MAALVPIALSAVGGAGASAVVGLGLSALSAYSSMRAGRAQAIGLARQSAMAQVQARGAALRYKEQGNLVYKNILKNVAMVNARAAAGGIDPFSGSALSLSRYAVAEGARELAITKDNEIIAREGGLINSAIMQGSANAAYRGGVYKALGTLGKSAMLYRQTSVPGGQDGETT